MKGFIHLVIRDLVIKTFSLETWEKVNAEAGTDHRPMRHNVYADAETLRLAGAICKAAGLEAGPLLKLLGAHFINFALDSQDGMMLTAQARYPGGSFVRLASGDLF
jgi:hypothetical protein